jgi:hypothetical protein
MKTAILFFISLCFVCCAGQPRQVTTKSLEGEWQAVTLQGKGITLDLANKTYSLSPEYKEQNSPEKIASEEREIRRLLDGGYSWKMSFNSNNVLINVQKKGETLNDRGTFKLVEGSPVGMVVTIEGKKDDTIEAWFEEQNLVLKTAIDMVITFKKISE